MNGKPVECYWLPVDNEDGAVCVYSATDVWIRRLLNRVRFLQHAIAELWVGRVLNPYGLGRVESRNWVVIRLIAVHTKEIVRNSYSMVYEVRVMFFMYRHTWIRSDL